MARLFGFCLITCLICVANGSDALQLRLPRNGLTVEQSFASEDIEVVGGRVSTLQAELDAFCNNRYNQLCHGGRPDFCDKIAVARYGTGLQSQQTAEWRCYAVDVLKPTDRKVQCVDDCGNYFPCLGVVEPNKTFHATAHAQILQFIEAGVEKHCSPFQDAGDKYCQGVFANSVARKDAGTSSQQEKKWRCYQKDSLTYEARSICMDNCGGERECAGGRSVNPPVCADTDSLLRSTKRSKAQRFIDDACQQEFDRLCKRDKKFCKTVVARKDRGRAGSQDTAEWRCYALEELNFQSKGSACIDECGNELPCQGGVPEASTHHVTWQDLPSKVKEAQEKFCSARQKAANDYCESEFPDSLARYGSGAGDHTSQYRCVKKDALRADAEAKCADSCKGTETCGGGRSRVDGPLSIDEVMNAHEGITKAMENASTEC
ncbi:unnamed protein product [Neospora caninum Liverpool]|uniref:NcMCP2, putative n=1 Tax=Neospora caninum (strain Liverpool) TaxID=572307 RepID=F0VGP9_NEOCL|nr:uncharacterized protein NCLIV_026810 [Neospora caninum Liverpool]CBZ52893.1 unnamed protein product [Neospora caninum Liverpool]CEL66875.1 TPA: NcMCP2, putative [Neospora caninum Liverpool]|eukprot:XP_003882925.1 uncharacterized protein NCLIV_026810 [Neospora caninum Liverpool]